MDQIQQLIQEEKAKIIAQTAKIHWQELEKFYAQGKCILVSDTLNLVDVGYAISMDQADYIIEWMESRMLKKDFKDVAQRWHDNDEEVWSVVINPWVLVQQIT